MDKNSKYDFLRELRAAEQSGSLPPRIASILTSFYESYAAALSASGISINAHIKLFEDFLAQVIVQCRTPYNFQPFHERVRSPFDYYKFGNDFIRNLIELSSSSVKGEENLEEAENHLKKKQNVIFLANHQIEGDPQAISLLLEDKFPRMAEEMIFIAGERVITDPLAIPFSMGRNLLCIYSKRYIDHPPELKRQKQLHNQKTMQLLSELLSEGGKCIYVAPSGGRDRPNAAGVVEVAPFDPQSVEMLYLMAKRAAKSTFFYPMALSTFDLLPPPETVQVELGEKRLAKRAAVHLAIGPCIDMEKIPGADNPDKHVRRKCRSDYIWNLVKEDYKRLGA